MPGADGGDAPTIAYPLCAATDVPNSRLVVLLSGGGELSPLLVTSVITATSPGGEGAEDTRSYTYTAPIYNKYLIVLIIQAVQVVNNRIIAARKTLFLNSYKHTQYTFS